MHLDSTLIAVVTTLLVSSIALWSNPKRPVNRVFFSASVHVAFWLLSLRGAIIAAPGEGLIWLRTASAIGAAIPLHLWLIKEVTAASELTMRRVFKASSGWLLL